jgi:WD40 repeat protein
MAKNPTLRYQTPDAAAEALAGFADGGAGLLGGLQPAGTPKAVSAVLPEAVNASIDDRPRLRRIAVCLAVLVLLVIGGTTIGYRIIFTQDGRATLPAGLDDKAKKTPPPPPAQPPSTTELVPQAPGPPPGSVGRLANGRIPAESTGSPVSREPVTPGLTNGQTTPPLRESPDSPPPKRASDDKPPRVVVESVKPTARDGSGEVIRFRSRRDRIRMALFSTDGRAITFASDDSDWEDPRGGKPCEDSLFWLAELGSPPRVIARELAPTHWVAAEPANNGRHGLSADLNGTTRWYDLHTGESRVLGKLSRPFHAAAISSDGHRAVLALGDRAVVLNTDSGKVLHTLTEHNGTVAGVSLTPDGTRAVTGGLKDHQVFVWDLARGSIVHRLHHEKGVHCVLAMPDGARFVTSGFDGTVRIWDLATGSELRRMPTPSGEGAALAVSPNGNLLLAAWSDSIWVWDLRAMQVVARISAPGHGVFALAFAPDGQRFVSTGFDRTVRIWQLPAIPEPRVVEEEEFLFPGPTDILWSVILSPDRRFLAVPGGASTGPGTLFLWDLTRRRLMLRVASAALVWPCVGAFTPDGQHLVTVGGDRRIRLWNLLRDEQPQTLGEQEGTGMGVAISPNGRLAATIAQPAPGVEHSLIHLWSLESGAEVGQLNGPFGGTSQVMFLRDGLHLLSSHALARAVVWDLETSEPVRKLAGEGGKFALLSDGRHAVFALRNVIHLIDINSGVVTRKFVGHTQATVLAEPSPNGRFLLTTAYEPPDSSVRVWDLTTGRQLLLLDVPGHPGTGGWLRDSRHFVFGDLFGAVHLYGISSALTGLETSEKPLTKAKAREKTHKK